MKNPIIIKVDKNKTIGIIISKEQEDYVVNFVRSNDLIPLIYEIVRK